MLLPVFPSGTNVNSMHVADIYIFVIRHSCECRLILKQMRTVSLCASANGNERKVELLLVSIFIDLRLHFELSLITDLFPLG